MGRWLKRWGGLGEDFPSAQTFKWPHTLTTGCPGAYCVNDEFLFFLVLFRQLSHLFNFAENYGVVSVSIINFPLFLQLGSDRVLIVCPKWSPNCV